MLRNSSMCGVRGKPTGSPGTETCFPVLVQAIVKLQDEYTRGK